VGSSVQMLKQKDWILLGFEDLPIAVSQLLIFS
jgi:hypothetical protein